MTDWHVLGSTAGHVTKYGYATRLVYHGLVLHGPTRTVDECDHKHPTAGVARRCAVRLARDRNAVTSFDRR